MEPINEQNLVAEIIQKAWNDNEFKEKLVQNPVQTIEETFGNKVNLPQGKKIVVRDQTSDEVVYINIPSKPEEVELSEAQLESVSGGVIGGGCILLPELPIIPIVKI